MDRSELCSILLLFLSLLLSPATTFPSFTVEPQDVVAVVNSSVTLNCTVIDRTSYVSWTKDGATLTVDSYNYRNIRYSITGDQEEGDFNLEINPVQFEDEGMYQCMAATSRALHSIIHSRTAKLTVLTPHEPAYADNGEDVENNENTVACRFENGKPKLNWINWFRHVMNEGFKKMITSLSDYRVFTNTSILKFTLKREHHNTTITCQTKSSIDHFYHNTEIWFPVLYLSKVNHHEKGVDVHQFCDLDSDPPILTFSWFTNDYSIVGNETLHYKIPSITQRYYKVSVKCQVRNFVDDHQFKKESEFVPAEQRTAALTCDINRNPPSTTHMIYKDTRKVIDTNVKFTVKVNNKTSGQHICEVDLTGLEEIVSETTILLKQKPIIISDRVQFGTPGKKVHLKCLIHTTTKSNYVTWSFQGNKIDDTDKGYTILEDYFPLGIESTLVITESSSSQFGSYTCSVSNAFGSDSSTILVKKTRTFPYYLIAVISGIFITASFIIYLYWNKKKNNQEYVMKVEISAPDGGEQMKIDFHDELKNSPESHE